MKRKYEDRDPAWTANHESRYQRGLLFGRKRGRPYARLPKQALIAVSLVDLLVKEHPSYDGGIRQIDLKDSVNLALELLSVREENIVRRVFGIGTDHPSSMSEVGRDLGRSVTCISMILQRALRKLRHPARGKYLKEFLVK